MVRRDRNEEPTLVSYIVPEIAEWKRWLETQGLQDIDEEGVEMGPCTVYLKRFRRIQAEVRDHLKSRLPAHSVPSIYIVLQKLPLNPNGKVDSPNLPFPDASLMTEDASEEDLKSWESLSETEKTIATQWSTLIPGLNAKMVRYASTDSSYIHHFNTDPRFPGQTQVSSTAVATVFLLSNCYLIFARNYVPMSPSVSSMQIPLFEAWAAQSTIFATARLSQSIILTIMFTLTLSMSLPIL